MTLALRQLDSSAADFEGQLSRVLSWSAETDQAIEARVTEILEPGGVVTEGEVERLLATCRDLFAESEPGTQVAMSGSLPPGAPSDRGKERGKTGMVAGHGRLNSAGRVRLTARRARSNPSRRPGCRPHASAWRGRFKGKPVQFRRCARNRDPRESGGSREPALAGRPYPRPGPAAGAWADFAL